MLAPRLALKAAFPGLAALARPGLPLGPTIRPPELKLSPSKSAGLQACAFVINWLPGQCLSKKKKTTKNHLKRGSLVFFQSLRRTFSGPLSAAGGAAVSIRPQKGP